MPRTTATLAELRPPIPKGGQCPDLGCLHPWLTHPLRGSSQASRQCLRSVRLPDGQQARCRCQREWSDAPRQIRPWRPEGGSE